MTAVNHRLSQRGLVTHLAGVGLASAELRGVGCQSLLVRAPDRPVARVGLLSGESPNWRCGSVYQQRPLARLGRLWRRVA